MKDLIIDKYNIIIDEDFQKYSPLINLSEVDLFEFNLKKFDKIYVYIDNMKVFYQRYKLFFKNCIFVLDKNIFVENMFDFNIIYQKYSVDDTMSFKKKLVHFDFLRDYLNV